MWKCSDYCEGPFLYQPSADLQSMRHSQRCIRNVLRIKPLRLCPSAALSASPDISAAVEYAAGTDAQPSVHIIESVGAETRASVRGPAKVLVARPPILETRVVVNTLSPLAPTARFWRSLSETRSAEGRPFTMDWSKRRLSRLHAGVCTARPLTHVMEKCCYDRSAAVGLGRPRLLLG